METLLKFSSLFKSTEQSTALIIEIVPVVDLYGSADS